LPGIQQKIVNFIISQPKKEEGVHVSLIARAIGKEGDAEKIRFVVFALGCSLKPGKSVLSDALDKLMDEGIVYTTIDDSHFQVAT
jgi:replication factor A2